MKPFTPGRYRELPETPRLPHDYARCEGQDLELDSAAFGRIRVHVKSLGSGPPLLLVHGLMTSSYSFRYVYGLLARHHRVIAPDLPGCGRTEPKPDRVHSARALATFVSEVQAKLGIEGCAAMGNSLGGYVCLWRALSDPKAFSKLVVVHSPAFPDLRIRTLHTALGLPGARSLLRWMIRRDPLRFAWKNVHYWDESLKSLEEAREYALTTDASISSFARYLQEAVAPDELLAFGKALDARRGERVPMPMLLAYARQDPMVPPSIGPRLAERLPGSELVWMDDTSHFAHVDTPQKVVDLVLPFLARS